MEEECDIDLSFKLSRDLKRAAENLKVDEARFLVDAYYIMQEQRKGTNNQIRALTETGEPHEIIKWFANNSEVMEKQIKGALDVYSNKQPLGVWARSVVGIGPVIASGLLAHIDLNKAPTAGHIWRYAGLDPTSKWEKGEKRPWNASLKNLCWKIGESFVKVSNNENDVYGKYYIKRKQMETEANERLAYKEQAEMGAKKVAKSTDAYKSYSIGKLPPAHIHSRAKRYAVKLFLAHYHQRGRELLNLPVPLPYPIAILGHAHYIAPPV